MILTRVSPSSINSFDSTTPFGCERRWWFKYVAKLEEPQTGSQGLGDKVHQLVERRLKEGKFTLPMEGEEVGVYLRGEAMVEAVAHKVVGVEISVKAQLGDVALYGYCDAMTTDGIIDWKTSSDVRRYGKTEEQLSRDTQLLCYARVLHPGKDKVKLAHGYFPTRAGAAKFVEVEVTKEHIDKQFDTVILPLVERMKVVAAKERVDEVTPDRTKCTRCPFNNKCPSEGRNEIMAFFGIKPPDAPESKPELAAEPIQAELPVVEPKKRATKKAAEGLTLKTVTVTRGAKLGLPNYSSANIEITAVADVGTLEFEEAYRQLALKVQTQLDADIKVAMGIINNTPKK